MNLKAILAIVLCKLLRALARILHRGGTAMPGRWALKLCPDLLARLSKDVKTVVITGTNGKTTSARMIEQAFREQGFSYLANRSGANLLSGVTTEFVMNCTLAGKMKKEYAVIECDEAATVKVFPQLKPRVVVVTNLFRDQLDRYGEVTHTLSNIREAMRGAPEALLCLNADCSLTASLGDGVPNRVVYYGVDGASSEKAPTVSDAPHCLRCGERYAYRRHTFAHLGDWYCPNCGAARPLPDLSAEEIVPDGSGSRVTLRENGARRAVTVALPAVYNVYNALSALTAARAMGWDMSVCEGSLAGFGAMFGRMESMVLGDTPVRIVLVKNPAGCDRALEYLATLGDGVMPVFCLNDNLNDGTDISWIYDADYESLFAARRYERIGVFGIRAQDMRLRLKYAGADDSAVEVYSSLDELADAVKNAGRPVCVLPNYTAMLAVRDKLSSLAGGGKFWEAN